MVHQQSPQDLADHTDAQPRQTKTDDWFVRETHPVTGASTADGNGVSRSLAGGGVHDGSRDLARTTRRQHSVHYQAPEIGGLRLPIQIAGLRC